MISNLIDVDSSGVYAVASKIGQISQLIYLAFVGGWQYFAFSIMRDKDNVRVISLIFEILTSVSLVTTLLGTSICKFVFELLFEEEYWASYICVPYLYLAPLMLMLFQVGSNQFLVIKKTWPNLIILLFGALLNIALNFLLIPLIGIEGASIATFIGYFVSILLCFIVLLKTKLISVRWKLIANVLLFFASFSVMRASSYSLYYLNVPIAIVFLLFNALIYRNDIRHFFKRLFRK